MESVPGEARLNGARPYTAAPVKIYTKKGDDGTTGLFYGGRVSKADLGPEAYGTVDEATSSLGVARALAQGAMKELILSVQRDLFVVGAELATGPDNRSKLEPSTSLTTVAMVERLEREIDRIEAETGMPTQFVVPGGNQLAASLDVARTVVRRAERRAVEWRDGHRIPDSSVVPYLNRLADLVYMMAREAEGTWTSSKAE